MGRARRRRSGQMALPLAAVAVNPPADRRVEVIRALAELLRESTSKAPDGCAGGDGDAKREADQRTPA